MDVTTTPVDPQRMLALKRANQVRVARAELKRKVSYGAIDVAQVILSCPWEVRSMAVSDLLMSQRRWGASRSRKILDMLPLSDRKTVGSLTHRQRVELAAKLIPSGSPLPSAAHPRGGCARTQDPRTPSGA